LDMSAALLEAKHPFRLVVFEGGEHGLTGGRRPTPRRTLPHATLPLD
jgi:hypothetical protein